MAASIQMLTTISGFPEAFQDRQTAVACDTTIVSKLTLAALNAAQSDGELTTRTSDTNGVVTLATGHGIASTNVVDVYWTGGKRYGMTATVEGNAVTVDGGAGDNLPDLNTEGIQVVRQTVVDVNFDGDEMRFVAFVYRNAGDADARAHGDFQDTADASIEAIELKVETSSEGLIRNQNVFNLAAGDTNVFTGNRITHVDASHNSQSAGTLYICLGYNA